MSRLLYVIWCSWILFALPQWLCAAADYRFELQDGSVIIGELVSVDNGVFKIRSPSLGTVTLRDSKVRTMGRAGSTASTETTLTESSEPDWQAQMQALQRELVHNDDLMQAISALQNDPKIREVLADPELMALIGSGDMMALRNDQRIQQLLEHPGIRAIVDRLAP